jgi:hypothetical protein
LVVLLGLAATGMAAAAPAASAAKAACRVKDTHSGTYASLQAAVNAAAPGGTLFVKGTCTGTTEIGKSLTIDGHNGSGKRTGILNGGGFVTVLAIDAGASVTLNSLVITNGFAQLEFGGNGGGIVNAGTVTLNRSAVTGNTAVLLGGGIYNEGGTVTLNGSTVTGNEAVGDGGGIDNGGGTVTLNGSTVAGNTATVFGGGIDDGGTVTLNGSTVTGNKADFHGGGIFIDCGSTLVGAVAGVNVNNNTPDNIATCMNPAPSGDGQAAAGHSGLPDRSAASRKSSSPSVGVVRAAPRDVHGDRPR